MADDGSKNSISTFFRCRRVAKSSVPASDLRDHERLHTRREILRQACWGSTSA